MAQGVEFGQHVQSPSIEAQYALHREVDCTILLCAGEVH